MKNSKDLTSTQFLNATAQLAHMDTGLAEWLWLQFFPKIWKIIDERQQQVISSHLLWLITLLSLQGQSLNPLVIISKLFIDYI